MTIKYFTVNDDQHQVNNINTRLEQLGISVRVINIESVSGVVKVWYQESILPSVQTIESESPVEEARQMAPTRSPDRTEEPAAASPEAEADEKETSEQPTLNKPASGSPSLTVKKKR